MNQPLKVKAIIFDRDGVIINTEGVVIDSVREAFKKLGFVLQKEDLSKIIGRSRDDYKDYFLKKWDFDFNEFRRIQSEYFYTNLNAAPYFEEAVKLIKALYIRKIKMAVTTSAGIESTSVILHNAGIDHMFKVIVTREDCRNLKPDPESYIFTSKKLKIDPMYCVAIEDTALGVEAAKKAGMQCIAIPNEFTQSQDFTKADIVAQSARDIEEFVEFI